MPVQIVPVENLEFPGITAKASQELNSEITFPVFLLFENAPRNCCCKRLKMLVNSTWKMADTTGITVQQALIRPGIPQDAKYLVSKQGLSSIEVLRSLKSEMVKRICKRYAKSTAKSTGSPVADPIVVTNLLHPNNGGCRSLNKPAKVRKTNWKSYIDSSKYKWTAGN